MIYLARHGDALSSQQDADRPLSEVGVDGVKRVASLLQNSAMHPSRILHSGVLRARQTADLLADAIAPTVRPEIMEGLHPMDPVKTIALTLRTWSEPVLLVGHNPFMEALTARLLTGHEHGAVIAFEPGTVAALAPITQDRSHFALLWHVNPSLVT